VTGRKDDRTGENFVQKGLRTSEEETRAWREVEKGERWVSRKKEIFGLETDSVLMWASANVCLCFECDVLCCL
jgi:hypothetical protein